jgi:two-component system, NtrC family, response regulator HydG
MARGCNLLAVRRPTRLEPTADDPFPEIDGASTAIRTLKQHMLSVARDPDVTVLILGESGTGKERVARAIHRVSPRSHAPFVVIDCASLSSTLVEDELYGHVRGAFTGAIRDQPGPFERARGGTVLLDEVGDLTPDLQMKLLRTLQARTVSRLGGGSETTFDVRVIASTNVDLAVARAQGRFREDLYYRLNVYGVTVPPLRSRGARDVRALAGAILSRLAARRRRPMPTIAPEALELLIRYQWPGNVRELENVLERMMVAAGVASTLTARHLPHDFGAPGLHTAADSGRRAPPPAAVEIISALERNGARQGRTAAHLGLSRYQLYRLMRRYGVRGPRARD